MIHSRFAEFLNMKKAIAVKLGLSIRSPKLGKIARVVYKRTKEIFSDKTSVEIYKLGLEHFEQNMSHYKQLYYSYYNL